jgi:predicted DCC family thiol-disulfide oxidoreductase YuxK
MARNVKVVWMEGQDTHAAWGIFEGEEDGFLTFLLVTGGRLTLRKTAVIKIEEERVR